MSSLSEVVSPKLTGRIAEYVAAITEARLRGVTWAQIATALGPVLGIDLSDLRKAAKAVQHAYKRASSQVAKGRLRTGQGHLPSQRPATRTHAWQQQDAIEDNAQLLKDLGVQVLK
jgi:hypothetical protein